MALLLLFIYAQLDGKMEKNGLNNMYNNEVITYPEMSIFCFLFLLVRNKYNIIRGFNLVYGLFMCCLCFVYVLSISCVCVVNVLYMWRCVIHMILFVDLVYVLFMCCLCFVYVLSMSFVCVVYVLPMCCLCLWLWLCWLQRICPPPTPYGMTILYVLRSYFQEPRPTS